MIACLAKKPHGSNGAMVLARDVLSGSSVSHSQAQRTLDRLKIRRRPKAPEQHGTRAPSHRDFTHHLAPSHLLTDFLLIQCHSPAGGNSRLVRRRRATWARARHSAVGQHYTPDTAPKEDGGNNNIHCFRKAGTCGRESRSDETIRT